MNELPHAAAEATLASAPEATEAATAAPRGIAGTATHGYDAMREAAIAVAINLAAVTFRACTTPSPHSIALRYCIGRTLEQRLDVLPRQAPRRPAIGFCGCMVRAILSLLAAGATSFDRLNEARQLSRSPSGHRTTPLVIGALACHLAINSSLGLPPRNTGGDLGLLPIDTAKADIAIGPCWPSRVAPLPGQASLTPTALRRRKTKGPTATSASNLDHLVR